MHFSSNKIRWILCSILFSSFFLPFILYRVNLFKFKSFVDFYFEFIHINNPFDDSSSAIKYLLVFSIAISGVFSTFFYNITDKIVINSLPKRRSTTKVTAKLVLILLVITGVVRIYFKVGHSQFQSELPFSGIFHYFSTSLLYLFFLYHVLITRSKVYFFSGVLIIAFIETQLLWRGFVLSLFIWYFLIFATKVRMKDLILTLVAMVFLYSALSNFRNNVIDSDNSEFREYSSFVTVLNRFQGFTRAYVVMNSNVEFQFTSNLDPIKQIDNSIWGLNPDIKNSIGGSTLGLLYFIGGIYAVFFYFHIISIVFVFLNFYGKIDITIRALFIILLSQFNLIFIEGVGVIFFLVHIFCFLMLYIFHYQISRIKTNLISCRNYI